MSTEISKNKKVAIIAGGGNLPIEVIKSIKELGIDFVIIRFAGVPLNISINENIIDAEFERISDLFSELSLLNVNAVVCCGYVPRPKINVEHINAESRSILEPIIKSFALGDEAIFRSILKLFENKHLIPLNISDLVPNLFPKKEFLTKRKPNKSDMNDAEKSVQILTLMSSADLGQSVVVSGGACLAFETSPGTDAMLRYLWMLKKDQPSFFSGGLLYKSPKNGQNLFIDQPVIGVNTVKGVKKAGLNGIVIKYAEVIVLEPTKVIKLANDLGIFIWSKK